MTRRTPERALHSATAAFLNIMLPRRVFWTTFPAGGGGKIRGAQLKRAGLKAGVPDLAVIHAGNVYFIELKAANGKLSPEQIVCHGDILAAGAPVCVCRSVDEVRDALAAWKIPVKGRIAA